MIDDTTIQTNDKWVLNTAIVPQTSSGISDNASVTTMSSLYSGANPQARDDIPKSHSLENWSLVPAWAKASLGNRNLEQWRRRKQEPRGSSGISTDPNYTSRQDDATLGTPLGLQIDFQDKPLPDIPSGSAERPQQDVPNALSFEECDTCSDNQISPFPAPPEMGFSFKPGDDASILSPKMVGGKLVTQTNHNILRQTSSKSLLAIQLVSSSNINASENRSKTEFDTITESSTAGKSSHISKDSHDSCETLSHGDSTSSAVTAVRTNSIKSSHASMQNNGQTGGQGGGRAGAEVGPRKLRLMP